VANTLKLLRNGAVGFIDWLDAPYAMECVHPVKIQSDIQQGQGYESEEESPHNGSENAAGIKTPRRFRKTGRGKVKPLPKGGFGRDVTHPGLAASSNQPNPSAKERSTEEALKKLSREVPEYCVFEFRAQCHSI
jgi:hypothetical protein